MLKILIIEDEKLNADRLVRLLKTLKPDVNIVGVIGSIKKSILWLQENVLPDLILMDVHLSDGLSFEIFNQIKMNTPVIFTTAHDSYALKAFQYNSLDYLLKPIEINNLEKAINKFELNKQPLQTLDFENLLKQMQPKEYRNRFLLPYKDGYKKISSDDIAYFNSQFNITYAYLFNEDKNVVPQTLEILDQELDPKYFFRINRQYIVHINAIEQVDNHFNGKLKLKIKNCTDNEILVSRLKASIFKNWLDF